MVKQVRIKANSKHTLVKNNRYKGKNNTWMNIIQESISTLTKFLATQTCKKTTTICRRNHIFNLRNESKKICKFCYQEQRLNVCRISKKTKDNVCGNLEQML